MEERSFKRAALFGILGSLMFYVFGKILTQFFPGWRDALLFESDRINFDLHLIAIQIRISLFVVIGFISGWAFCLFRRGGGS